MPVLVNKQSGFAENLEQQAADYALQSGTHDIPLNDPQGNPVTAPHTEVSNLLQQGYTQPESHHLQNLLDYSKHSTLAEQAMTGVEGAASALTLGASTAAERALGIDKEQINKRAEINPGSQMLGEAVGLGLGMLTGTGEAAILEQAGAKTAQAVTKALGEGAIGRIGSTTAKFAAENAIFQMGHEASRKFSEDPNQSAESAITDVGLSAVLGGATGAGFGSVKELWKLGPGKNVEAMLNAMKNRASGIPSELKTSTSLDIASEVNAAITNPEAATSMTQDLMDSGSSSGDKLRASVQNFRTGIDNAIPETLGRSNEELSGLSDVSKAETGKQLQDTLGRALDEKIAPVAQKYEKLTERFKSTELSEAHKAEIANQVVQSIEANGLQKGPNEAAFRLANKVIEQLPLQETVQDLRKYVQGLYSAAPYGSELYQTGKSLRAILTDAQERVLGEAVASKSPELFNDFKATQAEYGQFKGLLEELNDRLRMGREGKGGAETFVRSLRDMAPEDVANRLRLKDDTQLQALMAKEFPEVAEVAKKQEMDALLRKSIGRTGDALDAKKFFKHLEGMSPELRKYLMSEEQSMRLQRIKELLAKTPTGMNTSKTATVLDKMWSKVPAAAAAMAAFVTGHNPVIAGILGQTAHWLGREAPDAVKLAMLKFIGSETATNAAGFKAAAEMAAATLRGEAKLNKAVKGVFGATMPIIPEPSAREREKLQKQIDHLVQNRDEALNIGEHVGHYLPEHGSALALSSSRAVSYLESIRPHTGRAAPLDAENVPNAAQVADYNRALDLAQNPMLVLKSMHLGTLTPKDMKHLAGMYPDLSRNIQSKLQQEMFNAVENKQRIPYKTKLTLSMFLGQALDSSMTSRAILASQPMQIQPLQPMGGMQQSKGRASGLNKMKAQSNEFLTPSQNRNMQKTLRHK